MFHRFYLFNSENYSLRVFVWKEKKGKKNRQYAASRCYLAKEGVNKIDSWSKEV